jgi:WD40 repeat protein
VLVLNAANPGNTVWGLAFSPDGGRLASVANHGGLRLDDLRTGAVSILGPTGLSPNTVAFSPDGGEVVCGIRGGVVAWGLSGGSYRQLSRSYDGHAAFSPDGRFLAHTGFDLRERRTGLMIVDRQAAPDAKPRHLAALRPLSPAFSRDGRLLAFSGWRPPERSRAACLIVFYDPATGEGRGHWEGYGPIPLSLAFHPDGTALAATCGPTLYVWNIPSGRPRWQITLDRTHFQQAAFTPDGRFLVAVRNDKTVRFWETQGWTQAAAFDWDIGPLVSLAIAPDGMRAAAGSKRGKVVVWDIDL